MQLSSYLARVLPPSLKKSLYRSGPLAHLIRGSLNRAAPSGITELTVAAGALEGYQLSLDLQTEKDYWLGTYEFELQRAIGDWVQPGWVVYDVGANIGYISLLLAKAVGNEGRVFSFEALPLNVERLGANLRLNALESWVNVIHGAVGATSTPVRFLIGPSGAMGKAAGSAGRTEGHRETIEVPGYALDDFVFQQDNPPPQVVKMDIEGGEVLALPGMQRILAEYRPLVFVELHGPEAAQIAWDTLTASGYQISKMQPGYPVVQSVKELDWKSYLVARL
jgi:FkbM family methyltransferase